MTINVKRKPTNVKYNGDKTSIKMFDVSYKSIKSRTVIYFT